MSASIVDRLRRALPPLVGLALFAVALRVLHVQLDATSWRDLSADIHNTSVRQLLLAVVLTALNYARPDRLRPPRVRVHRQAAAGRRDRAHVVSRLRHLEQRRLRDALGRVGPLPLLYAHGA